jgi:hypothetical protein
MSPRVIFTLLACDELSGPSGEGYRRMIEGSGQSEALHRTRLEPLARCLWGRRRIVTGIDFLMDGGVKAAYLYGDLVLK